MRPHISRRDFLAYGLGYLALLGIAILVCVAMVKRSGHTVVDIEANGGSLHVEMDRGLVIWPDACMSVKWSSSGIKEIFLNSEGQPAQGQKTVCLESLPPVFYVVYANGETAEHVMPVDFLAAPFVIAAPIVPLALIALIAGLGRQRAPASWPVFAGFGVAFALFFIVPTFLNPGGMPFPQYVPAGPGPGGDLDLILSYSSALLVTGSPYQDAYNFYPPLEAIVFAPLVSIPRMAALAVVIGFTLAAVACLACLFPVKLPGFSPSASVVTLIAVTAYLSYGAQFELERGQFNITAAGLCFVAVLIFHRLPRWRLLAYALFSLSVQLKVYPAIFIVLLVDDWRAWKPNLIRFAALAGVNIALLFVLGIEQAALFVEHIRLNAESAFFWNANASIASFINRMPRFGLDFPGAPQVVSWALLGVTAVCLGVLGWKTYRGHLAPVNPPLVWGLAIAAMLLPSVSHDYKLAILAPGAALTLGTVDRRIAEEPHKWVWQQILILLMAFLYASTLFSFATKSGMFAINTTALIALLISLTVFEIVSPRGTPAAAGQE